MNIPKSPTDPPPVLPQTLSVLILQSQGRPPPTSPVFQQTVIKKNSFILPPFLITRSTQTDRKDYNRPYGTKRISTFPKSPRSLYTKEPISTFPRPRPNLQVIIPDRSF
jgi:hypothetical protein